MKQKYKHLAEKIINAVNQTSNDYDAREQIEEILKTEFKT
jgi:hypothetical protein